MSDIIDHPPHYEACRVTVEPIDVCEAYDFCTGNAIKYLCRAGKKAGSSEVTDLKKARWYLERALVEDASNRRPSAARRHAGRDASPRRNSAPLLPGAASRVAHQFWLPDGP